MADEETGFLRRWSRRKQAARTLETDDTPRQDGPVSDEPSGGDAAAGEFDPSSLPPVEELGPESDYSVFLRRAVPAALRVAALRRAWVTDPAITGYKTLADYDWDVNAPGYGQLRPTDDPMKLARALFRHLTEPKTTERPEASPELPRDIPAQAAAEAGPEPEPLPAPLPAPSRPGEIAAAPEREGQPDAMPDAVSMSDPAPARPIPSRRRHGGAVPT